MDSGADGNLCDANNGEAEGFTVSMSNEDEDEDEESTAETAGAADKGSEEGESRSNSNSAREALIQERLRSNFLQEQLELLEKQHELLRAECRRLQKIVDEMPGFAPNEPHIRLAVAPTVPRHAPSSTATSTSALASAPKFVLRQVMNASPGAQPLDEVPVPYRFSEFGAFPHAIDTNSRTRLREYQVEGRRVTNMTFALAFLQDGRPATEHDVTPHGVVPFRMDVLYADTREVVQAADFTRAPDGGIVAPMADLTGDRGLVRGKLVYSLRFKVASSDTPRQPNRAFMVRVRPTQPPLLGDKNLEVLSLPFIVRGKVTAPNDHYGKRQKGDVSKKPKPAAKKRKLSASAGQE